MSDFEVEGIPKDSRMLRILGYLEVIKIELDAINNENNSLRARVNTLEAKMVNTVAATPNSIVHTNISDLTLGQEPQKSIIFGINSTMNTSK